MLGTRAGTGSPSPQRPHISYLHFSPYFIPTGRVQGAEDGIQEQGMQGGGWFEGVPPKWGSAAVSLLRVSSHLGLQDTLADLAPARC